MATLTTYTNTYKNRRVPYEKVRPDADLQCTQSWGKMVPRPSNESEKLANGEIAPPVLAVDLEEHRLNKQKSASAQTCQHLNGLNNNRENKGNGSKSLYMAEFGCDDDFKEQAKNARPKAMSAAHARQSNVNLSMTTMTYFTTNYMGTHGKTASKVMSPQK